MTRKSVEALALDSSAIGEGMGSQLPAGPGDGIEGAVPGPDLSLDVTEGMIEDDFQTFPLTVEDMTELETKGPEHSVARLEHVRQYHHVIAKLEAAGQRDFEICSVLSISSVTLSNLRKSPLYVELVELYAGQVTDQIIDLSKLMGLVAHEALQEIHERITNPEKRGMLDLKALRELSTDFADRTGFGPIKKVETNERHTHGLDSETRRLLRERSHEDATLREIPDGARPGMERVSQFQSVREATEIVVNPEGRDPVREQVREVAETAGPSQSGDSGSREVD